MEPAAAAAGFYFCEKFAAVSGNLFWLAHCC